MTFPFTAVVGHDDVKLALLLAAVDPRIGGVLLRGQKGSAKTTLARGLAALLPGDAPFAELPIGASEDRLIGTLDLAAALTTKEHRFEPGILAAAHRGVLYVDEVNLLPDHLVDVLLDVAASGINRIEREGISHEHPARFVLIGSMNPEEGELRPQLLDRFGLAVDVAADSDPSRRAEAVRRRLDFDADPQAFKRHRSAAENETRQRLADAARRAAEVQADLLTAISALCASVGAEGLRADLVIARTATALARWESRPVVTSDDVRRVAPFALAHRQRRSPFEDPGIAEERLEQALGDALDGNGVDRAGDMPEKPTNNDSVTLLAAARSNNSPAGRRSITTGERGRLVRDTTPAPNAPIRSVAVGATVRAVAARDAAEPDPADIREAVREQRAGNLIVLAVDASGSMGADRRMAAVKGAIFGLLVDAYQRRDRVSLVTFRGDRADVALRPTGSVEIAKSRLAELPTGGLTPLASGIDAARTIATTTNGTHRPLLVLVSDGRATQGPNGADPVQAALRAATAVRHQRIDAVVVDAEAPGPKALGLARDLADAMGARYLRLPELSAPALEGAIREVNR